MSLIASAPKGLAIGHVLILEYLFKVKDIGKERQL